MRRPLAVLGLLAPLSILPACGKDAPQPTAAAEGSRGGLPDRDPALAHRLIAAGGVLIDVRTKEEYAAKHIDGAVNVPVDEVESRLPEIEKLTGSDKQKPIVVYCQAGGRAGRAKTMLTGAGYEQVTNLGGIADWDRP